MSSSLPLEERSPSVKATPSGVAVTPTITTTSTSTGRQSQGLQHVPPHTSTPDRRRFGVTTDDAAIFIEDTVDRATAQCLATSPSSLAILSPQRMPAHLAHHVDVTEYDAESIGNSVRKGRRSGYLAGEAVAAASGVRLSFGTTATPKPASRASGSLLNTSGGSGSGCRPSLPRSTPRRDRSLPVRRRLSETPGRAPARGEPDDDDASSDAALSSVAEPTVPLSVLEQVERERNRYEKMYEHQKALYEDMAEKHATTYASLQEKIVEVVALSTRNEESKKFIRQLKREMAESRTRVMDIQNRALEEAREERNAKHRYEGLIEEQERKYQRTVERHETRMAGLESLVKDLTCMRSEHGRMHVAHLDALLKAAYTKSTALFSDLLRQGRQIELLYDSKDALERQVDQLRRDRRELESQLADERRRMGQETERFIDQIEEQQQCILSLRQMLIRALGPDDDDDLSEEEDSDDAQRVTYRRYTGRGGARGERSFDSDEVTADRELGVDDDEAGEEDEHGPTTPHRAPGRERGDAQRKSYGPAQELYGGELEQDGDRAPAPAPTTARGASKEVDHGLAYLRSQRATAQGGRGAVSTSVDDEADGGAALQAGGGAVGTAAVGGTARVARGGSPAPTPPLTSHALLRRGGVSGGSIFSPPQRRASLSTATQDPARGSEGAVVARVTAAPAPRVPRAVVHAGSRTLTAAVTVTTAGGRPPLEARAREAYRIPRSSAVEDTAGEGASTRLNLTAALAAIAPARRGADPDDGTDKENRPRPTEATAGGARTGKPTAVGPAQRQPLAPRPAAPGVDDDEDDNMPRLVPKPREPRLALRPLAQRAEKSAEAA